MRLRKIHFAFIRPIFEHGCVVWDESPKHDILFSEIDKIRLQAARIVKDTNTYSSNHLLYIKTGWDKLSKDEKSKYLSYYLKS